MTNFTASMRDATKCQESLVENWFQLLVKTKLTFLGVEDAYFHTVCEALYMQCSRWCNDRLMISIVGEWKLVIKQWMSNVIHKTTKI